MKNIYFFPSLEKKNPIIMRMDLDDITGKLLGKCTKFHIISLFEIHNSRLSIYTFLFSSYVCKSTLNSKYKLQFFGCVSVLEMTLENSFSSHKLFPIQNNFHSFTVKIWNFQSSLIWNLLRASKNEFGSVFVYNFLRKKYQTTKHEAKNIALIKIKK